MRSGLVVKKIGMSRVYDENGAFTPVTLLAIDNCIVVGHKTLVNDGYNALQLGVAEAKIKNVSKPLKGFYEKAKIAPCRKIVEFRIDEDNFIDVGTKLTADHFVTGAYIDVAGTSLGKGFAGVVKRHGFDTLHATHGVSLSHRSHGSTGHCQDPGRVFKGKKMAGHLGNKRVTLQNLQVIDIKVDDNVIVVKGSVPGHKGSWIEIRDAVKKV